MIAIGRSQAWFNMQWTEFSYTRHPCKINASNMTSVNAHHLGHLQPNAPPLLWPPIGKAFFFSFQICKRIRPKCFFSSCINASSTKQWKIKSNKNQNTFPFLSPKNTSHKYALPFRAHLFCLFVEGKK